MDMGTPTAARKTVNSNPTVGVGTRPGIGKDRHHKFQGKE
jgi:hypothetical protein